MPKGNNQNNLNGLNPLSYLGVNPSSPADTVFYDFDPTPTDNNFDIGTVWINTTPLLNNVWFLTSLAFGVATWILVGTFNGEVNTLTTDGAVVIPPIGENINILGDGVNITTVGNAGTATIRVTLNDDIILPATNVGGTQGVIFIGGQRFISSRDINIVEANAFFGPSSGNTLITLTGTGNTGIGYLALGSITSGNTNTVVGANAGITLTSGSGNTFLGTSSGTAATTAATNVLVGLLAGTNITTGANNTGIGGNVFANLTNGFSNIAIGQNAGNQFSTENFNIDIANSGTPGDIGVLRIGTNGTHLATFITGIDGVNVGNVAKVVTVAAGATDQLGTATITAGSGISVTPGANTITISATTAFFTWAVTTVDAGIVVNHGYIANKGGLLTMTLPATAAIGDSFAITGINNATGWKIAQNANQQIFIGLSNTTLGVGGSLASSATRDSAEFVCVVAGANTVWNCINFVGNITVV